MAANKETLLVACGRHGLWLISDMDNSCDRYDIIVADMVVAWYVADIAVILKVTNNQPLSRG